MKRGFTLVEIIIVAGLLTFVGSVGAYYIFAGKASDDVEIKDAYFRAARTGLLRIKEAVETSPQIMKLGEKSITLMDASGESITYYLEDNVLYKRKTMGDRPEKITDMIQDFSIRQMYPIPARTYEITVVSGESENKEQMPVILQTTVFRRKY